MASEETPDASDRGDRPGKTRTWWHPLLARLLDHALSAAYHVQEELVVGKMPLRVDLLLLRREKGHLSDSARRELQGILPLLNRFTLIDFKGPTDSIEPGDLAQLVGCSFLWHGQQEERISHCDVTLILLAPGRNEALRDDLGQLGWDAGVDEPGIFRFHGAPFATWLVESDEMARRGQPILALVSRIFLRDRERIIKELHGSGHGPLLYYMLQQVQQFRSYGEEFTMQHKDSEYLGQVEEELKTAVLEAIPAEDRVRGLSVEERMRGLSPDQILERFSAEEILQRFTAEEILQHFPAEQILRHFPAEEILQRFTAEQILQHFPAEQILQRFTAEQILCGLSQEQRAQLREVLERDQGG